MDEVINSSDFEKTVSNFDNNFSKYLLGLLDRLSSFSKTDFQHQMLNIVTRLDHNGFYGKQLEKLAAAASGKCFLELLKSMISTISSLGVLFLFIISLFPRNNKCRKHGLQFKRPVFKFNPK